MDEENLKEKFKRIYRKSKRIDLEKSNKIFESIRKKQRGSNSPSTIIEISSDTSLSSNTVRTYTKHLKEYDYIKKNRKYTPPFLKSTNRQNDSKFTYGKENRDRIVSDEQEKVLSVFKSANFKLNEELNNALRTIKQSSDSNSKFLKAYNLLVEYLWGETNLEDFVKLEIGSGANKYLVY